MRYSDERIPKRGILDVLGWRLMVLGVKREGIYRRGEIRAQTRHLAELDSE